MPAINKLFFRGGLFFFFPSGKLNFFFTMILKAFALGWGNWFVVTMWNIIIHRTLFNDENYRCTLKIFYEGLYSFSILRTYYILSINISPMYTFTTCSFMIMINWNEKKIQFARRKKIQQSPLEKILFFYDRHNKCITFHYDLLQYLYTDVMIS